VIRGKKPKKKVLMGAMATPCIAGIVLFIKDKGSS
jgi:hypothetical protein